jgi:hypothetical protein
VQRNLQNQHLVWIESNVRKDRHFVNEGTMSCTKSLKKNNHAIGVHEKIVNG